MADIESKVPDIGSHDGVPVIELLVAVGDSVKKDQGLVTLESDKATMEVPSPFDGIVRELKVKIGDALSEGSVVAMIEPTEAGAAAPTAPAPAAKAAAAPAPAEAAPADAPETGPATAEAQAARPEPVAVAKPAPAPASSPRTPPVAFDADSLLPGKVPHASPAVRLFARELGVDLAQVPGSARAGRISKADVQAFVTAALADGGAPRAAGGGGQYARVLEPGLGITAFHPGTYGPASPASQAPRAAKLGPRAASGREWGQDSDAGPRWTWPS